MSSALLTKGLTFFTVGKLEEAARAWLEAKIEDPDNPQLVAYLRHVETLAPEVYAEAEKEITARSAAEDQPAAILSTKAVTEPIPVPIPVPKKTSPPSGSTAENSWPPPGDPALKDSGPKLAGAATPLDASSETQTSPAEQPPADLPPPAPILPAPPSGPQPPPVSGSTVTAPPGAHDTSPPSAGPTGAPEGPGAFENDGLTPTTTDGPKGPEVEAAAVAQGGMQASREVEAPHGNRDEGQPALDLAAPVPGSVEVLVPSAAGGVEAGSGPNRPIVEAPAAASIPSAEDPWGTPAVVDTVEVDGNDTGFALITSDTDPASSPSSPAVDMANLATRLKELFDLDDFTGALATAEEILEAVPDHRDASAIKQASSEKLLAIYKSKIGDGSAVPKVLVPPDELIWLNLDHRSGFVLAQIDGISTFEEIIDLTGMEPLESHRIIADLISEGVIGSAS